jgi:double-strand break repair protein MRE11
MPPRRRARGRAAAAAPAANTNDSSDSEPEQQQEEQQPHEDTNEPQDDENNKNNATEDHSTSSPPTTTTTNNNSNSNHPDENTLRILLSTDNHLGYLEKDPIRGNDSFAALEEVLSLARLHKVDLVLLSGDLFHDNKPSRRTLHITMEILRRYCMGGEAVNVQIVSDQKECLRSVVSGRANYEDEFYSVSF